MSALSADRGFSVRRVVRAHLGTSLVRNAYALLLNLFTNAGLGVVYWVIAARLYPSETVGLNSAVISSMLFLSGIAQFNFGPALTRFLPRLRGQQRRYIGAAYLLSALAGGVVGALFLLGLPLWSPSLLFLRADLASAAWFILATAAWGVFSHQDFVLVALRRTALLPLENALYGLLKIALLVGLISIPHTGAIFLAWTIPAVALILPVNWLIFARLIHKPVQEWAQLPPPRLGEVVHSSAFDYVGSLFALATVTLLPLLVTHRVGPEFTAYYYQAWLIAGALQFVATSLNTSLTVEVALDRSKLPAYARKVSRHAAQLLLPAVALIVLAAHPFLSFFGPRYAAEGTTLLRLFAVGIVPYTVVQLAIAVARVQRDMAFVVALQVALAATILLASLAAIGSLGLAGIGLAWLGTQTLAALVLLATKLRWLWSPVAASAFAQRCVTGEAA